MRSQVMALALSATVLSSCGVPPFARSTPDGNWSVVTDPSAVVGKPVKIVFRFRDDQLRPSTDSFTFTATCRTCAEPKPTVTGSVTKESGANELVYSGTATFTAAGTWWTSPYVGPLEVR